MDYTELSVASQRSMINTRLSELEIQHMSLMLRVQAPDINMPVNEMDTTNLAMLEESISKLKAMRDSLSETPPA